MYIVDGDLDTFVCSERFYPIYKDSMASTTDSKKQKLQLEVLEVLKKNSIKNITDLNKKIASMMHMDSQYKQSLLKYLYIQESTYCE